MTLVTSPRWPVKTRPAGARGTQSVCDAARFAGDRETSSCNAAFRFSRSII